MSIKSNEAHHVFTDDEVSNERKKIWYRIESSIGLFMGWLWIVSSFIGILLVWAFRPVPEDALGVAAIFAFFAGFFAWFLSVTESVDRLKPLAPEGVKCLQELSEANPIIACWVAKALEDGRTLRERDLRAAKVMDHQRRTLESQHKAEQAERAALLDLRDSARDSMNRRAGGFSASNSSPQIKTTN